VRDMCGISAGPTIKAAASSLAGAGALVVAVMVCKPSAQAYRAVAGPIIVAAWGCWGT
jgi:hypothetical protein